jgi:hypothetical protein
MKKILRSALIGTTLGAIGLTACDAPTPPQSAVSPPLETEAKAVPPGVVDVIREDLFDICRDQDPYSTARRLGTLLAAAGPEAVPAVVQTLENLKLDLRGTEVELLVWFWATHEPKEAALWAKKKAPVGYRDAAVYSALRVWARADPQTAVAVAWPWTEDLGLEIIVPIGLVRGWYAAGNPPELREWIQTLPLGIPGQRAIAAYIRVLIEQEGSQAAIAWAESLPDVKDESLKLAVFRRVVDALALLDVDAAMRWCETQCDGDYGSNMRSVIARNWARRDAPASLAWLSTAPEGYDRNLAVRVVWAQWSRADEKAAMAWVAAQAKNGEEPPAWIKPVYPVYARLLMAETPVEGIRWAMKIENEKERDGVLVSLARLWRRSDEAAVEEWLRQSVLPEEAREAVRAPLEKLVVRPPPS